MIKFAQIKKLASFYKLAVFIALASEQDVANALRELSTVIDYESEVIPVFDAWQSATDIKAPEETRREGLSQLENFYDSILSRELSPQEFDKLSNNLNVIIDDAEESITGSVEQAFEEQVEHARESVDVDLGEEHARQEGGGRVGETTEQMKARKAREAARFRDLVRSLKKNPRWGEILQGVKDGLSNEEIGITDEQYKAVKHNLSKTTTQTQRKRKEREIKRLMSLGLSREEAEEKYKSRQDSGAVSQDQIDFIKQRLEDSGVKLSDEELVKEIAKAKSKDSAFDKKKKIPLTQTQMNKLSRNRKKYISELSKKYPEDLAKKKAKEDFDAFKKKVQFMSKEEKDWEIDTFILGLYGKENPNPRPQPPQPPQTPQETSLLQGIDISAPGAKKPSPSTEKAEEKIKPRPTRPTRGRIIGPGSKKPSPPSPPSPPKKPSKEDELAKLIREQEMEGKSKGLDTSEYTDEGYESGSEDEFEKALEMYR